MNIVEQLNSLSLDDVTSKIKSGEKLNNMEITKLYQSGLDIDWYNINLNKSNEVKDRYPIGKYNGLEIYK